MNQGWNLRNELGFILQDRLFSLTRTRDARGSLQHDTINEIANLGARDDALATNHLRHVKPYRDEHQLEKHFEERYKNE